MTTFMKPSEVAKLLQVSESTILGWIASKLMPALNIGRGKVRKRWRINPDHLKEFERRRTVNSEQPRTRTTKPVKPVTQYV